MRLKIFKKYFVTTSVISLSGILVLVICLGFFVRNYLESEKKKTLLENCTAVAGYVAAIEGAGDFGGRISAIMNITGHSSDATYFVVDEKGGIIACGCDEWSQQHGCEHSEWQIDDKILKSAAQNEVYRFGSLQEGGGINYITAVPLSGGIRGAVFGISPSYTMRQLMRNMYRAFSFSAVISMAVLFVALYVMTLRLTRPMRMMSLAAQSITRGDFTMRIPVYGDDEISELSKSFNNMTDSLSRLENMRRSFIGNVSHELRTPMTTIGGFIDGILDGTIPEDQQDKYLRIISDEVKRLTRVVQSMLSLAKLESGEQQVKREKFDLSQVVLDIAISQEKRIEEGKIDIRGLEEIQGVWLEADRDLIYQVIFNLVDNAVKFTPENGYINFAVAQNADGGCSFKIRNSGDGIEEKDLPFVFERFYKTDRSRSDNKESSGIGLYIVRTIVSIHGGAVTVRSTPGEYAEFEVVLPAEGSRNLALGGKNNGK